MIKIGYSDFIELCRVDDLNDWMTNVEIRADGIYRRMPEQDASLGRKERAVLTEHPTKNINEPMLTFPCSLEELQVYLEFDAAYGCIDPFDMADFVMREMRNPGFPQSDILLHDFPDAIQVACEVYQEFWHNIPSDFNRPTKDDIYTFIRKQLDREPSSQELRNIESIARPLNQKLGGSPLLGLRSYKGKSHKK